MYYVFDLGTASHSQGAAAVLHKVVELLGLNNVVVISPSASGGLSIPYIFDQNYIHEIKGYVPVAPVIPPNFRHQEKFRTLSVSLTVALYVYRKVIVTPSCELFQSNLYKQICFSLTFLDACTLFLLMGSFPPFFHNSQISVDSKSMGWKF